MAVRKVIAREAVLFRSEDESNTAAAGQFRLNDRGDCRQSNHWLLGLAMGKGAGAEGESAVGDGFGEALGAFCVLEDLWGSDCGSSFAPVRRIGRDNRELGEAEVGHGARDRAYVERIARGDEDDVDAVAMVLREQGTIVVPLV